jgi:NADPH:quinone reductase-like Zn-dependent oxidoreductase
MKAIVQDRYGPPDVLELREIDRPVVGDDEVLVRVRAASVHPDVWHVVAGWPYVLRLMGAGLVRPKPAVPGTDVAGHVESTGKNVTRFSPGDEVFGETIRGYQWIHGGSYAEYVAVHQDTLAHKPSNVTFEQAASVPTSGLIALRNLRDQGRLQSGQKVLINGAGGGVGGLAVQLAKAFDAEVTGVDCASKLDLIRTLGADHVIDFAEQDFTRAGERYDLIFDVPGNHTFSECRRALTPAGRYVLIGHDDYGRATGAWMGSLPRFLKLMALSPFIGQLAMSPSPPETKAHLDVLKELLEAGKLTPIVDRTFPLSEVPDAIRYLQEGRAKGRIVLTV